MHLLVEYTGTVSSIERGSPLAEIPPYSIGDTIVGSLIIGAALAPTGELADDGQVGRYYRDSPGLDFILGPPHPPGRRAPSDPNLVGQLFSNDSLSQSFVVERDAGTNLWGYIESGFGELWNIVNFTLDRFSITRAVCRL